ncbi:MULTISPECIES: ATP-binding protein [Catenuloplanes]|uniref:Anti-sigma regulatory factor (Ser/Thr protein kinase) n=1 Tax=Catenuloplanes niger TaxID=587534 RepID=A0AAE4CVN1_9ACTN|nr:ATP-binding protein [Catenuloplanes niger]MDR7327566.1 anti-sigma regulatory factor (Ser/Thr protein kinase) [Catenuloplanes niger]
MSGYRLRLNGGPPGALPVLVTRLATDAGLSTAQGYRLRLAADELVTNAREHGYRGRDGLIEVSGGLRADAAWLRIEDCAPPFDPSAHPLGEPPYAGTGALTGRLGGCGLLLARRSVDALTWEYADGRNRTTLCVRRRRGVGRG